MLKFDSVEDIIECIYEMSESSEVHQKISKYEPPVPPPLPEDYAQFLESRTERERKLLEFAQQKLGSSFFVQWCHMYQKWKSGTH